MGSELYPYKGVLDRVANRNFADGTNAWTATDHTAYTLKTAGSAGFLNILPVYLDHILYPTLTDEACYTEVQHINGEGSNAGVVYCEMQAVENTRRSIVTNKLNSLLYPGNSGYKSVTGGRLLNLRSLTVETIRNYHRDYYRVDNLVLIVTGKVADEELFKALAPVEAHILSKSKLPPIPRPWTNPENIQPFTIATTEEVLFPSEDQSVGSASFAWRGPVYTEFREHAAIVVLWEYLTDSAVSPLTASMCEIEDPYGSSFSYYLALYQSTFLRLSLSDVSIEKLPLVCDCLFEKLNEIYKKQDINMKRMWSVISRSKLKHLESLENNPHETICDQVITDFLYGTDPSHLKDLFGTVERLNGFMKEEKSFWLNILKKYVLDPPCACVLGRPSAELAEKMANDEKQRIEKQRAELGEEAMKTLEKKLENAMSKNNIPAPNELYASQPIPSVDKISFIPVETVQNDKLISHSGQAVLDKLEKESADKAKFFLQFDHIKSQFVQIVVLLNTSQLPENLHLYLELYLDMFFKNAVKKDDGTEISGDDVVSGLTEDTIEYENSLGFGSGASFSCGVYAQYIQLSIKLETGKYLRVIDWYKLLLWKSLFVAEKIKVSATKLLNEIPKHKLDGFGVAKSVLQEVNFIKSSNYKASNFVRQAQFLAQVLKKLEANPQEVIEDLQKLQTALTAPEALTVQVAADIIKLTPAKTPWLSFLPAHTLAQVPLQFIPPQHSHNFLSHATGKGHTVAVPGLESAFLMQTSETGTSRFPVLSFTSPPQDIAAVMVVSTYFTMMEGLFWRSIRGGGLAYSFNITPRLEESVVLFYLYRSANIVKAYETADKIVSDLIDKKEDFDPMSLIEARSSCVHEIVEKAITVGDAAKESLLDYMRQWNRHGYHDVLKHVQTVSVDQLHNALVKYIKPIFDTKHCNTVVTTNTAKQEEIIQGFSALGSTLSVLDNLDQFHAI
eukprot:Phypoly_transcript_01756.p1 GENE.Phypoly_transcript_01756~~Phypoly_transcript_01756.p1  ORF type:complete len:1003 (+),score=143.28 Phypoly_transcript_01756:138-3011(+)